MTRRLTVMAALAALTALLFAVDDPHGAPRREVPLLVDGDAAPPGTGSTWFCAGGPIADGVEHRVVLTAVQQDEPVTARLTGFDAEGSALTPLVVEVPAAGTVGVDGSELGAGVNGVMVEFLAGAGVASHEQRSDTGADQERCDTAASNRWYFGAAATQVDSVAVLWLFNPFPSDASVDIGASTVDGFRTPAALSGVVVPARSARAVSLGEAVERRDRFSVQVDTREGSGPVVGALTQIHDGTARPDGSPIRRGLDLIGGRAEPATQWVFADGVGGSGYTDEVVIYNPADDTVTAEVQVVPVGVAAEILPDPIVVEIPGRRQTVVTVSAEDRVPADGVRWMSVRADGAGVIVGRVSTVLEEGGDGTKDTRPVIGRGLSGSAGDRWMATTWWFPGIGAVSPDGAVLSIVNPSGETIAVADVYASGDGAEVLVAGSVEVPPLSVAAIDLSEAGARWTTVRVTSESHLVAEMRGIDESISDQAIVSGIPARRGRVALNLGIIGG